MPDGYEPALTPARLTPPRVATPLPFVGALPTLFPFKVNAIDFPLTPVAPAVSVADRVVAPPYVPLAGDTARPVASAPPTSSKQTPTLESAGVIELLVVERIAW